jgi:hypothetical protein
MCLVAAVASAQNSHSGGESSPENAAASDTGRAEKLEDLIRRAEEGLVRIKSEIRDYECVLTKQERVNGKLQEPQNLAVKIRHEKRNGDAVIEPFSVYVRFLDPVKLKGREVIYVEGERGGDLMARRGGRRNPNMTVQLAPDGPLAMDGHRYPITQIGVVVMVERLIEVMRALAEKDDFGIKVYKDARLDGRPCTHFELTARTRLESNFMQARLFVDDEFQIPVYYAAYDWPKSEGGKPELLEMYAYRRVKLNVGLTDRDFDPSNADYHFSQVRPLPDDAVDQR